MIEFSHGAEAQVFLAEPKDNSCGAEVIRKDGFEGVFFKLAYYELAIANLLFPEHIINVRAAQNRDGALYIYSDLANVPTDHATYSAHNKPNWKEGYREPCDCRICNKHRLFHWFHRVDKKAATLGKKMRAMGVFVPYYDGTDFCQTREGQIVFFEVDKIEPEVIRGNIANGQLKLSEEDKDELLRLLDRYEAAEDEIKDKYGFIP